MEVDAPRDFAFLLRYHRTEAGFSREALALEANCTAQAIGLLESGKRIGPYAETVARLASSLGLSGAALREFELAAALGRRRSTRRIDDDSESREISPNRRNFPLEATSFVGQDRSRQELPALLRTRRIVTLTGPPGVGKTRLALRVLRGSARGPATAWFVELAQLPAGGAIVETVAAAVGLRLAPATDPSNALIAAIRSLRGFLVLDNCEHVIDDAARLAGLVAENCPLLTVVATSLEPLGIAGEYVFQVPPLEESHALTLFVERARAVNPRFVPTGDSLAKAVDHLGRIPLLIELAAARMNILSIEDLNRQLGDRFAMLSLGRRGNISRHRTLRALIDWSHDLLPEPEQALLRRVSIFSGGWNLESCSSVCSGGLVREEEVQTLLSSLVAKSLVVANLSGSPTRYTLLESTRAYANDKLESSGEQAMLYDRHGRWCATYGETLGRTGTELQNGSRRDLAELEIANVRAALAAQIRPGGDSALAARIALGFFRVLALSGFRREVQNMLRDVLEVMGSGQFETNGRLWLALSSVSMGRDKVVAARRAVANAEELGDNGALCSALIFLGEGLLDIGKHEEADEVIERACSLGDRKPDGAGGAPSVGSLAVAIGLRAWNNLGRGLYDEARHWYNEALELSRRADNMFVELGITANLATLDFVTGKTEQAVARATAAESRARATRFPGLELAILVGLVGYLIFLRRFSDAGCFARRGLSLAEQMAEATMAARILQHLAVIVSEQQPDQAARLLGYVAATYERDGYTRDPTEQATFDLAQAEIVKSLSPDRIEKLLAQGALLPEPEAISMTLQYVPDP